MIVLHRAPLVAPVIRPPIVDGAVAVAEDTIVGVGPFDDLTARHPEAEPRDWEGTLVPGLVNAHTHLQYTSFSSVGANRHASYVDWSERFVQEYEARKGENWAATARAGVEAGLRAGVTAYGDIVTDPEAMTAISDAGVSGVAYLEIIGVPIEKWRKEVKERVTGILSNTPTSASFHVGLSPHTPYTVDEPVLIDLADLGRQLGVRLHVHLAEVDSEDEYYRTGTGPLVDRIVARVGRPWSVVARGGSGMGAAEYARHCGLLGPDSHMAHGVYLDEDGRDLLDRADTYVALCPRSNLTVGGDPPPIADYLREGRPIAVGTDSLGSSQSLDVLEDLALLAELARATGYEKADLQDRLLRAATLGGASALGLEEVIGSLEPGKRADFAVFDVDSVDTLVREGSGSCSATVAGGVARWEG
jgi:cytosine/adenosine deaminase-related metal-dependent hydrolase